MTVSVGAFLVLLVKSLSPKMRQGETETAC